MVDGASISITLDPQKVLKTNKNRIKKTIDTQITRLYRRTTIGGRYACASPSY